MKLNLLIYRSLSEPVDKEELNYQWSIQDFLLDKDIEILKQPKVYGISKNTVFDLLSWKDHLLQVGPFYLDYDFLIISVDLKDVLMSIVDVRNTTLNISVNQGGEKHFFDALLCWSGEPESIPVNSAIGKLNCPLLSKEIESILNKEIIVGFFGIENEYSGILSSKDNGYMLHILNRDISKQHFQLGEITLFDKEDKTVIGNFVYESFLLIIENPADGQKIEFPVYPKYREFIILLENINENNKHELYKDWVNKNYKFRYQNTLLADLNALFFQPKLPNKNTYNFSDLKDIKGIKEKSSLNNNQIYLLRFDTNLTFNYKLQDLIKYELVTNMAYSYHDNDSSFASFTHLCEYSSDKNEIVSPSNWFIAKAKNIKNFVNNASNDTQFLWINSSTNILSIKLYKFNQKYDNLENINLNDVTEIKHPSPDMGDEDILVSTLSQKLFPKYILKNKTWPISEEYENFLFDLDIKAILYTNNKNTYCIIYDLE